MPITNVLLIGEEELDELLKIKAKYKKSLQTINNLTDIISYNDKDEDEKLTEIHNEVTNFICEIHSTQS